MSGCKKCGAKQATARALTRADAEAFAEKIADDMMAELNQLVGKADQPKRAEALAMAQQSILLKRPQYIVQCDSCKFEWLDN